MPSLPSGVVGGIENIEEEIIEGSLNTHAEPSQSDTYPHGLGVEGQGLSNKLLEIYSMFQDHIKGYSKALDHSASGDPGLYLLIYLSCSL
jgi:hypothetical protein